MHTTPLCNKNDTLVFGHQSILSAYYWHLSPVGTGTTLQMPPGQYVRTLTVSTAK